MEEIVVSYSSTFKAFSYMDHGTSISYTFCYAKSTCDGHQWWGTPITFKNTLVKPITT